jgi:hypothetical protein
MPTSPHFLIYGEDQNDRAALRHIVKAILPPNVTATVQLIQKPIVLSRNAERSGKRKSMSEEIASFARSFQKHSSKVIVIAHHDCDAVEPAHKDDAVALEADLTKAGVENPIAATPAWEMETWWMLFPDAVAEVRSCWRKIDYGRTNVGMIENAKERLIKDLRPQGKQKGRCPDYCEADSVKIAKTIESRPELLNSIKARSESFAEFRNKVASAAKE